MLDEDKPRKSSKLRLILFILGPVQAGLFSLTAFAGVDYPKWLMFPVFIITFPLSGWFVCLSWWPFIKGWIEYKKN
jgi:hypothetical protein